MRLGVAIKSMVLFFDCIYEAHGLRGKISQNKGPQAATVAWKGYRKHSSTYSSRAYIVD
jgi:hypothetical protein